MFVTDEDEGVKFGVQSKALSKRHSVPLGANLDILRSDWWVITVHANSDNPVCYIMRREEVQQLATQDAKNGNYWLIARSYDRPEYHEAWHRIDQMRRKNDPITPGIANECDPTQALPLQAASPEQALS